MQVYENVQQMVGNTPMLKINSFDFPEKVKIFAKLEYYNPGGSVKDRIGFYIIKKAEEMGLIKKGTTIIEATAGNTGIGVALAAINKGYRVIFVVPEKFSKEKQLIMKALGAEIINTPEAEGLKGAFRKVEELKNSIKDVYIIDQFNNQLNPEAHYQTTAKEIYQQMAGDFQYLVAGAGSGGTITGIMEYLKDIKAQVKGILVDPIGSTIGGGQCSSYKIEGIGNDFIPSTLKLDYIDEIIKVSDEEAFYYVEELAKREGILVGSSSGAAMAGAIKLAKKIAEGKIVVIFPDRADRYLSKGIYSSL
ncbi:PLP-dependent cysteine synthase family protein [Anaerobranca gottschalkii]|uniref:Cysteine synthase n=1 Tax=Anaerobranca gottschalkii DSM 13577 TaxID=1120990 RepID=A0A1I0AAV5_9FIRM|nr:cysteine synthase family protein [Anaerobranca gottschalkii]SES91308.1 cystathionine beta-synthase (acetylserine-dependent) [Anaerobranca gottschalkii DSM 13577]